MPGRESDSATARSSLDFKSNPFIYQTTHFLDFASTCGKRACRLRANGQSLGRKNRLNYNRPRMVPISVPLIENRWVCISTRGKAPFAAVISSYVQDAGVYFPIFEFPSIDVPYSPSSDFGKDGYLGRILGDRAAHEINNCLARIQPDKILLSWE